MDVGKFSFGQTPPEQEFLERNRHRAAVFRHYMGHLRAVETEVFSDQAAHHFVYARGSFKMVVGEGREDRPEVHFGRVQEIRKDDPKSVQLDSSTVREQGLAEATVYQFAIPVFPKTGQPAALDETLANLGIKGESMQDWLESAMGERAFVGGRWWPIPRFAIIVASALAGGGAQAGLSDEDFLYLGFLLSHCSTIIVFDHDGRTGVPGLEQFLEKTSETWYKSWVNERTLSKAMSFRDVRTTERLSTDLDRLLSFASLKDAWRVARRELELEE